MNGADPANLLMCFKPADVNIAPAAASCNLKYRSAPEWTGKECLLNATVWGESSQVTWGASNNLPKLHRAVASVVRFLPTFSHCPFFSVKAPRDVRQQLQARQSISLFVDEGLLLV